MIIVDGELNITVTLPFTLYFVVSFNCWLLFECSCFIITTITQSECYN